MTNHKSEHTQTNPSIAIGLNHASTLVQIQATSILKSCWLSNFPYLRNSRSCLAFDKWGQVFIHSMIPSIASFTSSSTSCNSSRVILSSSSSPRALIAWSTNIFLGSLHMGLFCVGSCVNDWLELPVYVSANGQWSDMSRHEQCHRQVTCHLQLIEFLAHYLFNWIL